MIYRILFVLYYVLSLIINCYEMPTLLVYDVLSASHSLKVLHKPCQMACLCQLNFFIDNNCSSFRYTGVSVLIGIFKKEYFCSFEESSNINQFHTCMYMVPNIHFIIFKISYTTKIRYISHLH